MKKKLVAMMMVLAMAVGTLSGCGSGSGDSAGGADSAKAGEGAHLNFGCYVYSTSFDPAAYQNASWQGMRWGITEALFKFNDDATISPWLADDYQVSDDHKTWTFHIRDGVKFSNGNACDAQAVADSLNRLFNVCENTEYSSTPRQYIDMASIEADTEANTVTIVTNVAYADLRGPLCFPFYTIIDVEGDLTDENHEGGYTTSVIGTGPYVLDSFDELSKSGELVKNENYWDGEVPYDSVTMLFIEDDTTKAMAIESGDIDLTENVTTISDLQKLEDNDDFYVSKKNGVRIGFALVNFEGILGNDTLRQAVFMAIDGQTLCDVTVGGMYTYGPGVIPEALDYDSDKLVNPYAYDQKAAIKLLDDNGIVDTDGDGIRELDGENIVLEFDTYKNRCLSDFAEGIQSQLSAVGIGCKVNVMDSDTLWMEMQEGDYDLTNSNWITVGTGDPEAYLLNWYGNGGENFFTEDNTDATNYCKYDNEEFNKLYDQFKASLDEQERKDLVVQMEQVLIDDCAVLVHGYYNSTMISNASRVTGAEIPAFDYYWLTTDIKPAE
ncbi:MAG TPA: ABC transporter substrate-binding protein [Candidatus Egerieimonas intestinavium]|uniref:ABC transporter substrate-binding protein n=1 Tax=Candidatus Egerieimonas intestinavium TaxID=2840777 RepID=A0A9D1JGD0_9FIRM|nr:ABC transporter substrate-binding protein [Candidatus Egerieimonas intestinavium]